MGNRIEYLLDRAVVRKHRRKFSSAGVASMRPFARVYSRRIRRVLYRKAHHSRRVGSPRTRVEAFRTIIFPFSTENMLLVHLQAVFKSHPVRQGCAINGG